MKSQRQGSRLELFLEGAIGETTPLFNLPVQDVKELVLDMSKVTYINSIGVKHWILWTVRLPADCQVKLVNTPFVIASQASMVMGFTTPNMKIESIRVPYACDACGVEDSRLLVRGKDYEYGDAAKGAKPLMQPPEHETCPKCGAKQLEPDFIIDKTFKFLG